MTAALFHLDGQLLVPTELARGPWDPAALHGGPTAAAVMRAAEAHLLAEPGGVEGGWQVSRMTVELLRPVPLAPLTVDARTVRPGRKVRLVAVTVTAGTGERAEVARAVILAVRSRELDLPARLRPVGAPPPLPEELAPVELPASGEEWPAFHNRGVEMRWAEGRWRVPGPATVWMCLRVPVVAGEAVSASVRAAALADFPNGISNELEFRRWRFLNPELSVHLARPPEGDWIRLAARSLVGPSGVGMAEASLADRRGDFGRSVQSLLIEPG
jgi:acyl-coenzyme A thioesterase PaaI-like protein